MKAINYYLVIQKIKEEPKNVGGFIITDKQSNDIRYLKAIVISAGDLVKGINEGDIIHYDKHAGHGIEWEDKLYQVIQHQDVVIVE